MKFINHFLTAALLICFVTSAQAYYSTFDTADSLKLGEYSLGLEPQYIFTGPSGGNIFAHFDMGVEDSASLKFLLGTGSTVVSMGSFFKYIPIPDYKNQPGIGFFAGLLYTNNRDFSVLHFRLHPLISKKFQIESFGLLTPYVSMPFGIATGGGVTKYPVQFTMGSKYLPEGYETLNFLLELGFDLNAAFSYLSAGVSIPFEAIENFKVK